MKRIAALKKRKKLSGLEKKREVPCSSAGRGKQQSASRSRAGILREGKGNPQKGTKNVPFDPLGGGPPPKKRQTLKREIKGLHKFRGGERAPGKKAT